MVKGSHFVLVHGACCGAWCWYKLVPLLRCTGNRVTAVDLAASGKNPKQVDHLSTLSDYVEPLMQLLSELPHEEKVVLVGHSMGGVAISIAMERFPRKIRVAVFLTAYMPGPDPTQSQRHMEKMLNLPESYWMDTVYTPNSFFFGPDYIARMMYSVSPPEDIALAESLMRPCPKFCLDEESPNECKLTKLNYGSVRRVYIVCAEDIGIPKDGQLKIVEKNPPDEVREIINADHMVMCSQPLILLSHLIDIAKKYN